MDFWPERQIKLVPTAGSSGLASRFGNTHFELSQHIRQVEWNACKFSGTKYGAESIEKRQLLQRTLYAVSERWIFRGLNECLLLFTTKEENPDPDTLLEHAGP
uniref:Uncharacterized protein n=1 Tax=Sphaerodactylus townsendi TaxID=933632 RepID=A0ACB8EPJ2_9SAUR